MKKTMLSILSVGALALGILGFAGLGASTLSAVESDKPVGHPVLPPV